VKIDFAEVKPSLLNVVIVGLMACIFIVFMKFVTTRWQVPGLTQFFAAV
jgi:riboflavin transporter FmnP